MNSQQFNLVLQILVRQTHALERIADTLERLAPPQTTQQAPNLVKPLEAYPNFDWQSVGAYVERSDEYGPAVASWGGRAFTRRSPQNKYGEAIWYSRCVGKNENGNIYERLITFKVMSDASPVSRKAQQYISQNRVVVMDALPQRDRRPSLPPTLQPDEDEF